MFKIPSSGPEPVTGVTVYWWVWFFRRLSVYILKKPGRIICALVEFQAQTIFRGEIVSWNPWGKDNNAATLHLGHAQAGNRWALPCKRMELLGVGGRRRGEAVWKVQQWKWTALVLKRQDGCAARPCFFFSDWQWGQLWAKAWQWVGAPGSRQQASVPLLARKATRTGPKHPVEGRDAFWYRRQQRGRELSAYRLSVLWFKPWQSQNSATHPGGTRSGNGVKSSSLKLSSDPIS